MRWIVGTIAAPRPVGGSLAVTVKSLRANGWDPIVFAEPGTEDPEDIVTTRIERPATMAPLVESLKPSPSGVFGNFQNYIQAAADLLHCRPTAEAVLITEDDAQVCRGAREWIEGQLWSHPLCGCVSLYTANIPAHRSFHPREIVSPKTPIMGSLSLIWRPDVLRMILESPDVQVYAGNAAQSLKRTPKWKRTAVDTFLGQQLRKTGFHMRLFTRSLVRHWCPTNVKENSACGNGAYSQKRTEYSWVGEQPDLPALFAPKKARR